MVGAVVGAGAALLVLRSQSWMPASPSKVSIYTLYVPLGTLSSDADCTKPLHTFSVLDPTGAVLGRAKPRVTDLADHPGCMMSLEVPKLPKVPTYTLRDDTSKKVVASNLDFADLQPCFEDFAAGLTSNDQIYLEPLPHCQ